MPAVTGHQLHRSVSIGSMLDTTHRLKPRLLCCKQQRKSRPKEGIVWMTANICPPFQQKQSRQIFFKLRRQLAAKSCPSRPISIVYLQPKSRPKSTAYSDHSIPYFF